MSSTDYPDFDWHSRWVDGQKLIAVLEADRDALREAHRWIPVGERLPEPFERVLVPYEGEAIFGHYDDEFKKWRHWGDKGFWAVTHWMPLPAPPESSDD